MHKLLNTCFLVCIATAAWAFSPVVVIGVDGAARIGSSDPSGSYGLGTFASLDYRSIIGKTGYFGSWLDLRVDWDLSAVPLGLDSEEIGFVVGTSGSVVELEAGAQVNLSTGLLGGSPSALTDWHALAQLPFGTTNAAAGIAYSGQYAFDPDSPTDRNSHSGMVFIEHSPSLFFGYLVAIDGSVELYAEAPILDGAGAPTAVQRSDYLVGLTSEMNGLAGYFTSWDVRAQGGVRLSNANRYIDFTASVEPDSEDRVYGRLSGQVQSSPTREWGVAGGMAINGAAYFGREALSDGVPTGVAARFLTTSLSASAEWSPDAHLYLTLAGAGSFSFSNDTEIAGWSSRLSAAISYRF